MIVKLLTGLSVIPCPPPNSYTALVPPRHPPEGGLDLAACFWSKEHDKKKGGGGCHFEIRLVASVLFTLFLWLFLACLPWWKQLPRFELSHGEANSSWGTETLGPIVLKELYESYPAREHGSGSFPSWAFIWEHSPADILITAQGGPWARRPSQVTPRILTHRNWEKTDLYFF